MKSKIKWLLALPGRIFRSLGIITVSWEQQPKVISELCSDEVSPLILAELRKQTILLEVLAKQGDWAAKHERYGPPYTGTGSSSVSGSSCLASASPPPS